ncbi:MAG TPA: ATP-binding protein [Casimicrobiaceae bacterium]|nr:ATP-binding protein [Casimicrobiaceae bacterium]
MPIAREFLRTADLLPEPLLLVARDGAVVAASRAARRLCADEAPAGVALASLCDATPDQVEALLRSVFRTRELVPGTLVIRTRDGERRKCRVEGALYRPAGPGGPALAMLRMIPNDEAVGRFVALNQRIDQLTQEIAARRRIEATLQEERERLRVTLWSIGDGVITTDPAARVRFMNPVAEQLTGWTIAQAVGLPLDEVFRIVHEDTRAVVENPVHRVLREGRIVGLANHTALLARDGTERAIADSGAPVRDEHGRIMGVVLVFHDVSERNAMERAVRQQARELMLADRRKDEFLAMLAHELRNPLAPLANGLQILRMHAPVPPQAGDVLDMMQRQLRHLTRMVDDLLDVARITRGAIQLRREPLAIAAALKLAIEQTASHLREHRQPLEAELPPPALRVNADPTRLAQVFANLLSNASKFSPDGTPIRIDWERRDERHVRIRVRDQGIGMTPEAIGSVFELFVQGNTSLDRSRGGLGIGLTVVRALVEMHDGRVLASSAGPGQGSEFCVDLPLLEVQGGADTSL